MATITNIVTQNAGSEKKVECLVQFGTSYPSSGELITAAELGMSRILRVDTVIKGGYFLSPRYNALTGESVRILAYGTGPNVSSSNFNIGVEVGTEPQVYIGTAFDNLFEGRLYFQEEMGNFQFAPDVGFTKFCTTSGSPVDDTTMNITQDATPAVTGVPIYYRIQSSDSKQGIFVANTGVGTDVFQDANANTFYVYDDPTAGNPSTDFPIYVDDSAADGLRVISEGSGENVAILSTPGSDGQVILLPHDPGASGFPQVYYDAAAVDPAKKWIANMPGAIDITNTFENIRAAENFRYGNVITEVYYDSSQTFTERFIADLSVTGGFNIPVRISSGQFITVYHDVNASLNGVPLRIDPFGSGFLTVAGGSVTTTPDLSELSYGFTSTIPAGTDLSVLGSVEMTFWGY